MNAPTCGASSSTPKRRRIASPSAFPARTFWLASTIYVSGSILILQRLSRDPEQRWLNAKSVGKALVIGVGAAVITHLVFQELFLVRLP